MDHTIRSAKLRGLETAWIERGENNPTILMMLHGYPDNAHSWDLQIAEFEKDFHVVAPFSRGARPSEKSAQLSRYGHTALALDQLQILQNIDPKQGKKVILLGHDLGGTQAWHLATYLGKRLEKMIIINSLHARQWIKRIDNPRQVARSWYIGAAMVPYLPEKLISRFPSQMLAFAHRTGGLEVPKRPKLATVLGSLVHPVNQYRAYIRDIPKTLRDRPQRIRQPVLILWSDQDSALVTPTQQEMSDYTYDCTIRILEGHHWLQREHPETVNTLIREFIASDK